MIMLLCKRSSNISVFVVFGALHMGRRIAQAFAVFVSRHVCA